MGAFIPVCLADAFGIKALAVPALCLVAYLYCTGLREKRELRRERRMQEQRRRETQEKAAQQREPPQ
jgi:heme exporter protein D